MKQIIYILLFIAILIVGAMINAKEVIAEHEVACSDFSDIKEYARCRVTEEWSVNEWKAFDTIITKESSWTHSGAHNPKLSSAFGLGGFLDATWESVGCIKTEELREQIDCTIKYVRARYHNPSTAKNWHLKNNWY